jgi:nucleoside-diphosphate-sugar epimerase
MRIIVVGAGGTIGSAVCDELGSRHELIKVGRNSGDIHADMADRNSIEAMYRKVGKADAVVCAAGAVHFGPLDLCRSTPLNRYGWSNAGGAWIDRDGSS